MAKEQEKAEKDNIKRPKAGPKGKAKSGKAAKPKASKSEQQDQPENPKAESNATANSEAPVGKEAETNEVVKPKKSAKPRRKPAAKPSKVKEEQENKPSEEEKDTTLPAADVQGKEEMAEEITKPTDTARPKKKSRGRKKGGRKSSAEQKTIAEQENAPAPAAATPITQETEAPKEAATEEPAPAAEAIKPKKKGKSRKKKPKKTEATLPPEPPEEAPIIVQENKVVIASKNPAKVKAVEIAYGRMFPGVEFNFESILVPSGVSEQPMTDDETFAGALYRAQMGRKEVLDGGYWVGIEGGLEEIGDELHAFAWVVLFGANGIMGKSRTSTFVLPEAVSELIRDGKELGEADDIIFGQENSKQGIGAVGILTHGVMDRPQYYAEAVVMSLIPFKNSELYPADILEKEVIV